MKTIKLFNGSDWYHRGGHLYVGAYSVADAARLLHEAHGVAMGRYLEIGKLDIGRNTRWINTYFGKDCWGDAMDGIKPERGVWWGKGLAGGHCEDKPRRLL